jgi:mRNA interferase RelE/StbE
MRSRTSSTAQVQEISQRFETRSQKPDRQVRREILNLKDKRIANADEPPWFGKPLQDSTFGLWRYRLRDDRIIGQLLQAKLIVLLVTIGDRSIL